MVDNFREGRRIDLSGGEGLSGRELFVNRVVETIVMLLREMKSQINREEKCDQYCKCD